MLVARTTFLMPSDGAWNALRCSAGEADECSGNTHRRSARAGPPELSRSYIAMMSARPVVTQKTDRKFQACDGQNQRPCSSIDFTRVDERVNSAIIIRLQEMLKALHGNATGHDSSTTTCLFALTRQENQDGAVPKCVVNVQNQLLQQIQINARLIYSRQVPSRTRRVSCISFRIIMRVCWRSICIFVAPPRLLPAYRKA